MRRDVKPEILDSLPPDDPRAVGSRADLRRLNFLMGHAGFLTRALFRRRGGNPFPSRPLRLVELGAGDGTLMLRLARRWAALGARAEVTLLDRQNLVSADTRRAFATLHWSVETVESDVFSWLESSASNADAMLANLFLHHFEGEKLAALLRLAAARTNLFVACEPRRSPLAMAAARSLALIGCNAVTRHDAVASVRAGFADRELSSLWPTGPEWALAERSAGLFSHAFRAEKNA